MPFVYDVVVSWLEGPRVADDPWELAASGQHTNEWQWFEGHRDVPATDGGERDTAD